MIAGGGVYGTYVAWELARRDEDVLLLEREHVAGGASGGPGKRGVRANGRDPRELPLMNAAYEVWPTLADRLGTEVGYDRVGHLQFVERTVPELGPTTTASAPAQVWAQERAGVPSEWLDAEAVAEVEPDVSDDVVGAVRCPNDGVVDHTALTEGLATAARRAGAEVREGTGVEGVATATGRVDRVVTTGGDEVGVGEEFLLLTNGDAAGFLDAEFGVSLPVWEMAVQVILTEPVDRPRLGHLIGHSHRRIAMKAVDGGRIMVTGGWPAAPDGEGGGTPVPDLVDANLAAAAAVYPALDGVGVADVTATHLESCCIDGIPIVDRVPGVENAITALGWTGHGFAIAPAVSERLAEWAVTGERPPLLAPFSLDRFGT